MTIKTNSMIAEQIITQDGVARIFEIPQSGLVAKPIASRAMAAAAKKAYQLSGFAETIRRRKNSEANAPPMVKAVIAPSPIGEISFRHQASERRNPE